VKRRDKENMTIHIKNHISYPTTKAEMVKACNNMSDISEDDKDWFIITLPECNYNSADEVINAIGW
jgi:hypothetical protein